MADGGHDEEDDAAASEGTVQQRLAAIEGHLRDLTKWAMTHDDAVDRRLKQLERWATEDAELIAEMAAIRDELQRRRTA